MIRPTLRAVLAFTATLPLAVALLVHDATLWPTALVFGLFVLALIAVDAALCLRPSRLTISVDAPPRISVGREGRLTIAATIDGAPHATTIEILPEQSGDADRTEPAGLSISAGTTASTTLPIRPLRRGRLTIDAVWLRWRGPLGLAGRTQRRPLGMTIDVVPDIHGISSSAIQFFSRDAVEGIKVQRQKGEGTEFEALRDHVQGLDNRFIDWKHSAKHLKLLSKEFRVERNHQIVLAFDTGYLMAEPIGGLPRLDHAIHAGLLLGWVALRSGDHVGSFAFDAHIRQFLQPSRGRNAFARLHNGSAALAYRADETNFTLGLAELNARLKRRALVILFTEFIDTTTAELLLEGLQRMTNRHAVIFVTLQDPLLTTIIDADPASFRPVAEAVVARDLQRDRAIVLERLARMGVHCLEIPPRALAVNLVNRYLTIKQRGLL
ncbi:DUF58 domain-containing protein [Enterovirga rhinocerotis]|uniref:Uncharacterized protein (DUF58 family) n=1 Tax=Enterovirga rhinocerotis TaxID=1339210 RepID=A0A4R7BL03_9HYPH|nr:DUF58 domain-containing protein [Enterovirga rhinocerotis]TDR85282.1 uncharacterized protein (DUF58 family) [Enterovirga rhinocerotis]